MCSVYFCFQFDYTFSKINYDYFRYKTYMVNASDGGKQALFKCIDCGFLTLKENVIKNHCLRLHQLQSNSYLNERRKIKCIGCSNIFHSKSALQVTNFSLLYPLVIFFIYQISYQFFPVNVIYFIFGC